MKIRATTFLLILFLSFFLNAFMVHQSKPATWRVDDDQPADSQTIQEAINAAKEGDFIIVKGGTYREHVTVNKSVSITGEDGSTVVVDGNGIGTVILVAANNVIIEGLTVRNGRSGIVVLTSQNCTIKDNLVEDNGNQGIFVNKSQNCTLSRNHAAGTRSGYGININASHNIQVEGNGAISNYFDGIGLLLSDDSIVRGNTVYNNTLYGIWVDSSSGNVFYHNNLFGNGIQVTSNTPSNAWDNGVEGNYWGDFEGADADADGVSDLPYTVDEQTQQTDNSPLMRPYINEVYRSIDIEPPVASFTVSSSMPYVNETVEFDASGSDDIAGRGSISDYEWDFGDGEIGVGKTVSHRYVNSGNYTVTLTLKDVAGNVADFQATTHVRLLSNEFPIWIVCVVPFGIAATIAAAFMAIRWKKKEVHH